MRVPNLNLDQWVTAVLWRWTDKEIDIEGLRAEVFDLMRLPVPDEELEALKAYFEILLARFETGKATTGQTVVGIIELIHSTYASR